MPPIRPLIEDGHPLLRADAERADEQAAEHGSEHSPVTSHVGEGVDIVAKAACARLRRRHLPGNGSPGHFRHRQDEQERYEDSGQADQDQDQLPAVQRAPWGRNRLHVEEGVQQKGAGGQGEGGPDHRAQLHDGHRPRHPLAREEIGEQGIGCRTVAGFTRAHDEPGQEQLKRILRHAAQRRPEAPDGDPGSDDPLAAVAVDQAGDRNADDRVEQGEGRPEQQAQVGVRQMQVRFDLPRHVGDDVGVDLQRRQRQDQQEDRVVGHAGLRPGRGAPGGGGLAGRRAFSAPAQARGFRTHSRLLPRALGFCSTFTAPAPAGKRFDRSRLRRGLRHCAFGSSRRMKWVLPFSSTGLRLFSSQMNSIWSHSRWRV